MRGIVLRRIAGVGLLALLVVTLVFVVVQAAPGTYADTIDNSRLSPETRELIRARYVAADPPVGRNRAAHRFDFGFGDRRGRYAAPVRVG